MKYYEGNIEPADDVIFVFGSNPEGRHASGSAKVAITKFGAIYGQGEGLQGNAYALPTKDLRVKKSKSLRSISLENIESNVRRMYDVARSMPDKKFMVAYRNKAKETTLCGYSGLEMLKCFLNADIIPDNVYFSSEWRDIIYNDFKRLLK